MSTRVAREYLSWEASPTPVSYAQIGALPIAGRRAQKFVRLRRAGSRHEPVGRYNRCVTSFYGLLWKSISKRDKHLGAVTCSLIAVPPEWK